MEHSRDIYYQKQKRNSKGFSLSSPFIAKLRIVINFLFLIESIQNSSLFKCF